MRCCEDRPADIDIHLAALMRRAPCPVWTVQPWAGSASVACAAAVVGVDPNRESRAAAHAAASTLHRSAARSIAQLFLVHGLDVHPAELAAVQPWAQITASMQIARHPWIERLASELAGPELLVAPIVEPTFAPELIGGVARCQSVDFIALGSRWRSEGTE